MTVIYDRLQRWNLKLTTREEGERAGESGLSMNCDSKKWGNSEGDPMIQKNG